MAFELRNFSLESAGQSDVKRLWAYKTTVDDLTTVSATGYFNDVADRVSTGDVIFVTTTSNPAGDELVVTVTSNVNTTVTGASVIREHFFPVESNLLNSTVPKAFSWPTTTGKTIAMVEMVAVLNEDSATGSTVTVAGPFGTAGVVTVNPGDVSGTVYQVPTTLRSIDYNQKFTITGDGLGGATSSLMFTFKMFR